MYLTRTKDGRGGSESVYSRRPFLNLITCEWNPQFATRGQINYDTENKPWIESRAELGAEDDGETHAEPGENENDIRAFMHGPDESDVCLPRVDRMGAFCFGASLESLQAEKLEGKVRDPYVAWLDERSFATGEKKGRPRTYRGPLTARDLYRELKKPRFRCRSSTEATGDSSSPSPSAKENENENENGCLPEDHEPDAERRLIFITDLDRWSTYALIGTASYHQLPALRDALYKHVAFESFIGVAPPSKGLPMFQLSFHLPYYVWRSSQKACEDHRRDANAGPLRQFRDVSFLNSQSSESSSFLYEAQISCVVSGSDEWRWIGYCFVDTYFDSNEEARESVVSYHEDSEEDDGLPADPFTYGVGDRNYPIRKPREYFLNVFGIRIKQISREWQQVVAKFEQSIREHIEIHNHSRHLSLERSSKTKDGDEQVQKSHDWVVLTRENSSLLSQKLSETVDACESFCLQDAYYFRRRSASAGRDQLLDSLPAIQMTFEELRLLQKKLEFLVARCDDFAQVVHGYKQLEHQLMLKNKQLDHRQHRISEDSRSLSVIMMLYISPIALTAGIFSMNKDVIPFIPTNFGSFVGMVVIFGALGGIIHSVQINFGVASDSTYRKHEK
ncbi:hypothetical protein G7Y89_g8613 [Cudoniella acicularis]|uniref:Uncharacterized protein n=1 Tax=Cudoniella acicularis TaxID=354080 RepID=A0A8H4W0X5_9HELO|nr:hypothetical protein G7Y89_g8613 [Cudoniella acicularis]